MRQPNHPRVLIVEDEPDLLQGMTDYLGMEGFAVEGVFSLQAAEEWLETHDLDILVLDLGLPDGEGRSWFRAHPRLRGKGIIVTSAHAESAVRLDAIRAGADLYLVKPVLLEELSSLMHNLARRLHAAATRAWMLDATSWALESPEGVMLKLTHSEHLILSRLARSPGLPVSRSELVIALGKDPETYDLRRMEILVRRLRQKAKEILGYSLPVETVNRGGYAFAGVVNLRGRLLPSPDKPASGFDTALKSIRNTGKRPERLPAGRLS